jgi:hypothetical protein
MTLIICLDDKGGMIFNKRRQSRDLAVIKDMLMHFSPIRISGFSEKLFSSYGAPYTLTRELFDGSDGASFLENIDPTPYLDKISRLVIYNWNRLYPSDMRFSKDSLFGFRLRSVTEFVGDSHDKITREIYER